MLFKKVVIVSALFFLTAVNESQAQNSTNPIDSTKSKALAAEQKEARRVKYLNGLQKIDSEKKQHFADSITASRGYTEISMKLLSEEYQKINVYEFDNRVDTSDFKWTSDVYVDSEMVIRAKVLRHTTKQEEENSWKELKDILYKESQTPQAIERNKIIASQVNKPAPDFSVVDVDGNKYDLKALKGKIVVLNFWFIGCGPCRKEMPKLNALVEKYKSKDVVFLAFEVNNNTPGKIKAITRNSFLYTQIPSNRTTDAATYNIKTYPTSYVIDQSGIIRLGFAAYNPFKLIDMDKTIESLLKNSLVKN